MDEVNPKFSETDVALVFEGRTVDTEIEIDTENEAVHELEINFVSGSKARRIDGAMNISIEDLPASLMERACQRVATMVDGFSPSGCERGQNHGRIAYRIRGQAGDWKVKIKLLENGEILEMQKKRLSRAV